jgi:hypothetical protein
MGKAQPPEWIPCAVCRQSVCMADRSHQVDRTATGIEVWAYHCATCDKWIEVRVCAGQPDRYLSVGTWDRKPGVAWYHLNKAPAKSPRQPSPRPRKRR